MMSKKVVEYGQTQSHDVYSIAMNPTSLETVQSIGKDIYIIYPVIRPGPKESILVQKNDVAKIEGHDSLFKPVLALV